MRIKEQARQAYRDQQSQDNEGGCGEPIGFITGYIQAYEVFENMNDILVDALEEIYQSDASECVEIARKALQDVNKLEDSDENQ